MKKMKKLLLITLVLCMVFSIPVSAKSKKKLGFDEYFDIYVEYFGNLIDPILVNQCLTVWSTSSTEYAGSIKLPKYST